MRTKKHTPYLYMLPGVLMVLCFVYIPVLMNIVYSFFRLSSFSAGSTFVGLYHLPDRPGGVWNGFSPDPGEWCYWQENAELFPEFLLSARADFSYGSGPHVHLHL